MIWCSITLQLTFSSYCLIKNYACTTLIGYKTVQFFTQVITHTIINKLVGYHTAASFEDRIHFSSILNVFFFLVYSLVYHLLTSSVSANKNCSRQF